VVGGTEFSLRCPLSGSRIKTPARFVGVPGLTAFDLETFLGMVKRSKKWQCPHSMRNLPVQDLMIDGYLSRVLPRLQVWLPHKTNCCRVLYGAQHKIAVRATLRV